MPTFYANSMASALHLALASDAVLVSSGYRVDLYHPINSDPDRVPWIGIFGGDTFTLEGAQAQASKPWRARVSFLLMIQEHAHADKYTAQQRLNDAISTVWLVVNSNRRLDGQVDMLVSAEASPYQPEHEEDERLLAAELLLTYEVYV